MSWKRIVVSLFMLASLFLLAQIATASDSSVTVTVTKSGGSEPLGGVSITAKKGPYWVTVGNTDAAGKIVINGLSPNDIVRASYQGSAKEITYTNTSGTELSFETTEAKLVAKDTNNQPLIGAAIIYNNGAYDYHFGTTNADGIATKELFEGSYTLKASYNGTTQTATVSTISNAVDQTFVASNVRINFSGNITYTNGYAYHFTNGMALFPGSYDFQFGKYGVPYLTKNITIEANKKFEKSYAYLSVKSSSGSGIADVTAKFYTNTWFDASGKTDANGNLLIEIDGLKTNVTVQAWHKGSNSSKAQDIITNSFYDFQTRKVTLKLLKANGSAFENTEYTGQFYAQSWKNLDNVAGADYKQQELFPGSYSFSVAYNGATLSKTQDISANPNVVFQTGLVKVNFAGGTVQYYTTSFKNYTDAVELLPIATDFYFSKAGLPRKIVKIQPEAGKTVEKTVAYVRLTNSGNAGIAGGSVQYYDGGWNPGGTTDSDGVSIIAMDGLKTDLVFKMSYAGASVDKGQNLGSDSFVLFKTVAVTVTLKDSGNSTIASGGTVQYYASGWNTFGSANTSRELLPADYVFKMSYAGASQDIAQNVTDTDKRTVAFATKAVTVALNSSANTPLGGGTVQYYADGWRTFGNDGSANATMQLLPSSYVFKMSYAGASQDLAETVSANTTVTFATKSVTVELLDSNDQSITSGGTVQYYASGWNTFGNANTALELLPSNYVFKMNYAGASQDIAQNVGFNPLVTFKTVKVAVNLLDSGNIAIASGGAVQYYASGWNVFGDANTSLELLPVDYVFKMSYAGASQDIAQNVGTNSTVTFQTIGVTVELHNPGNIAIDGYNIQYYASGWNAFDIKSGIQLLPGQYVFKFSYNDTAQDVAQDIGTNPVVSFIV
ncbi:hypothetical protein [Paenibacillus silvisoli]|uniref:hypothetical protein n=1 Tax=Paenibacillus silvisoli TaxID=3110539 RepID=UPI00280509AB|nr:hypothetical protein [Paenibacillus silvisoli]